MKVTLSLALASALFVASPAGAVLPTFYVDTAGNGGSATVDSGTTDVASSSIPACQTSNSWTTGGNLGCTGTGAGTGVSSTGTNAVTLFGQPNFTGMPTDGSQFIFLTGATNTNQKVFQITGVGTCNGAESAGTCVLTITGTPTGVSANATWTIGGRVILPDTSIEGALVPGTTVIVNTTQATCGSATVCFTFRVAGDTTNGAITLQGKNNGYQTLVNTSNASVVIVNNVANAQILGLTLTTVGTSTTVSMGNAGAVIVRNNKINCNASSGACITSSGSGQSVLLNEITSSGGTGAGISSNSGSFNYSGNNIHGVGGDCIVNSVAGPSGSITDNIINGCGGWGIHLTGATAAFTLITEIEGNTCYNPTSGCLSVSNKQTQVRMWNNIFYESIASSNTVNYPSSNLTDTSLIAGGSHDFNDFYCVSSCTTNFVNFAASSTDVTTNPGFANAAGGNFAVLTTGGAYGAGGPLTWLNGSTTSVRSIGIAQVAGVAGAAGIIGGGF